MMWQRSGSADSIYETDAAEKHEGTELCGSGFIRDQSRERAAPRNKRENRDSLGVESRFSGALSPLRADTAEGLYWGRLFCRLRTLTC